MDESFLHHHRDQALANPLAGHPLAQDTGGQPTTAPLRAMARASGIFEAETRVMPGLELAQPSPQIAGAMLTVIRGVDAGRSFALDQPGFVIGRTRPSDIQLRDDSVSRSHLLVAIEDGDWFVHDSASCNGTRVNDTPLRGRRRLYDGDLILLGESLLRFHGGRSEALGTTAASPRAAGELVLLEKPTRPDASGSSIRATLGELRSGDESRRPSEARFPSLRYACTTVAEPRNRRAGLDTHRLDEATDASVVSGSFTCRPIATTIEAPALLATRWSPSHSPAPILETQRGAPSPWSARAGGHLLITLLALLAFCLLARHYTQEDQASNDSSSEEYVETPQGASVLEPIVTPL